MRRLVVLVVTIAIWSVASPARATFPGANGRIAFSSTSTPTSNPDGKTNLTNAAGNDEFPDGSPVRPRRSVASSFAGIPSWVRIKTDYGSLTVTKSAGGWSKIKNTKTIKFSNALLNYGSCALLGAKSDAVIELACCSPPTP